MFNTITEPNAEVKEVTQSFNFSPTVDKISKAFLWSSSPAIADFKAELTSPALDLILWIQPLTTDDGLLTFLPFFPKSSRPPKIKVPIAATPIAILAPLFLTKFNTCLILPQTPFNAFTLFSSFSSTSASPSTSLFLEKKLVIVLVIACQICFTTPIILLIIPSFFSAASLLASSYK